MKSAECWAERESSCELRNRDRRKTFEKHFSRSDLHWRIWRNSHSFPSSHFCLLRRRFEIVHNSSGRGGKIACVNKSETILITISIVAVFLLVFSAFRSRKSRNHFLIVWIVVVVVLPPAARYNSLLALARVSRTHNEWLPDLVTDAYTATSIIHSQAT